MPPKAAKPPAPAAAGAAPGGKAAVSDVGISVAVQVIKTGPDVYKGLVVRLIGTFLECSNSPVLGEQLPWAPYTPKNVSSIAKHLGTTLDAGAALAPAADAGVDAKQVSASHTWPNFDVTTALKDPERAKAFHASPGLYAVLLGKKIDSDTPDVEVPISFAYVDCSYFMFDGGKTSGRSQTVDGLLFEMSVVAAKPLMERERCVVFEPLVLHLDALGGYPVLNNELEGDALDPVYVYGKLELGSFSRSVFVRPLVVEDVVAGGDGSAAAAGGATPVAATAGVTPSASDGNLAGLDATTATLDTTTAALAAPAAPEENLAPLGHKICLLPGMADLKLFKECLTSATFVLQVHREDVHRRAFSAKHIEELAHVRAQTPATGGAKPAGKGGEAPVMAATDAHLVACIDKALATASQVSPHGTVRFRLEDLLSSSSDLLKEFALRRAGRERPSEADREEGVTVREDMLLEVRLAKPSKPPKVARPADASLRAALQRAREDETGGPKQTIGLGETLAATTLGRGFVATSGITHKARHEQFFECGTRVTMSAELHRQLEHPTEVPTVLPEALFRIREQRQYPEHYALLANRTEAAIGFTSTMIPQRTGFGAAASLDNVDPGLLSSTLSLSPTKMQLQGSTLGLAFDTLNYDLFLSAEVQNRLAVTPFTRMVLVFKYDDDDTLLALNDAVAKVNMGALPDIQGSLRSYALDESELEAASKGELDVVTGVMIIDDDTRMVILEGLAAPGGGMQSIYMDLPRPKENDANFKLLCNPEVLFPDRLYPSYGPELKRIRLRDKLRKLARRPELYNRKQVDEVCFASFDGLMTLRRAQDLRSTKDLCMYPTVEALNTLELLYGEAVSRADLDGLEAEAQRLASLELKRLEKLARLRGEDPLAVRAEASMALSGAGGTEGRGSTSLPASAAGAGASTRPPRHKSGPSDCRNPAFEDHLRTRPAHRVDHIAEHREQRRRAWVQMLHRRDRRDQQYAETMSQVLGKEGAQGGKIYLYSTQSLNFKDKAMKEMQARLGQVKNATFTFSKDFVSQTLCLVDEETEQKRAKAQSQQEWLTSKGFRYPAAKTRQDLITHPKRPPDVIIEDLKEPWMGDMPPPVAQGESVEDRAEQLLLEKGYTTRVSLGGNLFGGLKAPEFARPFELRLVGDRTQLPRGTLVGGTRHEPDPAFFRSVHLGGEKQAEIIAAAAAKEKEDWAAKVVVENTSFQVGKFNVRDRPMQLDRTDDILHDEPKRRDLKTLRHKTSKSTGKVITYEPPPLSVFSTGQFVQNEGVVNLLRKEDRTKFITTVELAKTGKISAPLTKASVSLHEVDFKRLMGPKIINPRLVQVVATRKHPPQDRTSAECVGPKWTAPAPGLPPI